MPRIRMQVVMYIIIYCIRCFYNVFGRSTKRILRQKQLIIDSSFLRTSAYTESPGTGQVFNLPNVIWVNISEDMKTVGVFCHVNGGARNWIFDRTPNIIYCLYVCHVCCVYVPILYIYSYILLYE